MYQYGSDEDDIQLSTDDFDGYGEVEAGAGFQDRDWWVAVKDLRPWAPFSDNSVWPAFPVAEFKTGTRLLFSAEDALDLGPAVLYDMLSCMHLSVHHSLATWANLAARS